MQSYALDELPWTDVARALERDRRLIFPVGALEQHGPHLPLGANTIIASSVARDVSASLGILGGCHQAPKDRLSFFEVGRNGGPCMVEPLLRYKERRQMVMQA